MAFHKPIQKPTVPVSKANQDAPIKAPVGLNGFFTFSSCFVSGACSSVLFFSGSIFFSFLCFTESKCPI
ncbi:hypothetical protein D3C86_1259020 [compost metagenome]